MSLTDYNTGCFICGKDLIYLADAIDFQCFYCGKKEKNVVACSDGHYVCDKCHSADSMDIIEKFLNQTDLKSALAMAEILMKIPGIKMHGPEHHFIVPGTLLASWCNVKGKSRLKKKFLRYARLRAEKVPGGFCGTHGNCGAAVGTGIFMSLITGATSISKKEYRQSNLMTSIALENIAMHGGPRCCKRNSWLAITDGIKRVKEEFNVDLPLDEMKCSFSHLNRECLKEECRFYDQKQ
jgi:predicted RNA-binding Zn-ribbon protein involved in translation (DUF1610 family)